MVRRYYSRHVHAQSRSVPIDSPNRSGGRPAALTAALVVTLFAVFILRGLVLTWTNQGRVSLDDTHNAALHGRYYPVEELCPLIDDDEFTDAMGGTTFTATGNELELDAVNSVYMGCGWEGSGVSLSFQAVVFIDGETRKDAVEPSCEPTEQRAETAKWVSAGGYRACEWDSLIKHGTSIQDDNVFVVCGFSPPRLKTSSLEGAVREECAHLVDQLARNQRPISFWGNGFWTVL